MFLAILSDSFGEVKAEIARRKNAFEMGEYFKAGYTNFIDRMGLHTRKMDIDEALRIARERDYNNKGILEKQKKASEKFRSYSTDCKSKLTR